MVFRQDRGVISRPLLPTVQCRISVFHMPSISIPFFYPSTSSFLFPPLFTFLCLRTGKDTGREGLTRTSRGQGFAFKSKLGRYFQMKRPVPCRALTVSSECVANVIFSSAYSRTKKKNALQSSAAPEDPGRKHPLCP